MSIMAVRGGAFIAWLFFQTFPHPIISSILKQTPLIVVIIGALAQLYLLVEKTNIFSIKKFLILMWFTTPATTQLVLSASKALPKKYLYSMDQGWLELYGAQGYSKTASSPSSPMTLINITNPPTLLAVSSIALVSLIICCHSLNFKA
jgi:hypothetical protein